MSGQALVSVIVPVYNAMPTLPRAMASLQNQSVGFDRLQVIIVDNGSTDNSAEWAAAFAQCHDNVLLCEEKMRGPGSARNAGLACVVCDYVMFLDADDTLVADAIESLLAGADKGFELVAGGYYVGEQPKKVCAFPQRVYTLPAERADLFAQMRDSFWCKLYLTNIIRDSKLAFLPQGAGEDLYFLYTYMLCCRSVCQLGKIVYHYRPAAGGMGENASAESLIMLGHNYAHILTMFKAWQAEELFSIVGEGILDFHLARMLRQDFRPEAMQDILAAWAWFFEYMDAHSLVWGPFSAVLCGPVLEQAFDKAAQIAVTLRPACESLDRADALAHQKTAEAERLQIALNEMLGSRSWKLASGLQKLAFWRRRK